MPKSINLNIAEIVRKQPTFSKKLIASEAIANLIALPFDLVALLICHETQAPSFFLPFAALNHTQASANALIYSLSLRKK